MLRFLAVAANHPPVAVDDAYSTDEDYTWRSPPPVCSPTTRIRRRPLTATLVIGPTNGTLVLNADGSFTYTPNPDFNGSDTFTYVANDGTHDSAPATVTITVNPVNDAPVAADDGLQHGSGYRAAVAHWRARLNDTEADGDALTVNTL